MTEIAKLHSITEANNTLEGVKNMKVRDGADNKAISLDPTIKGILDYIDELEIQEIISNIIEDSAFMSKIVKLVKKVPQGHCNYYAMMKDFGFNREKIEKSLVKTNQDINDALYYIGIEGAIIHVCKDDDFLKNLELKHMKTPQGVVFIEKILKALELNDLVQVSMQNSEKLIVDKEPSRE